MITLITPTGGRPEAFALCERYMARQSVRFNQWIVVDDCKKPTRCTMGQEIIRPDTFWQEGDMTLPRNISLALEQVKYDNILIIEDDDWYHPDYIKTLVEKLEKFDIVGEGHARYYNVANYGHMIHQNNTHASLCMTGFSSRVLEQVKTCVEKNIGQKFLDIEIWKLPVRKLVYRDSLTCVGIKGMKGRGGIGYGHKGSFGSPDAAPFYTLRKWIGNDAEFYEALCK